MISFALIFLLFDGSPARAERTDARRFDHIRAEYARTMHTALAYAHSGDLAAAQARTAELVRHLGHLNATSRRTCDEDADACHRNLREIVVDSIDTSLGELAPFDDAGAKAVRSFLMDLAERVATTDRLIAVADAEPTFENLAVVRANVETFMGLYAVGWVASLFFVIGEHPEWTSTTLWALLPAAALATIPLRTPFPARLVPGDANRIGDLVREACETALATKES